MCFHLPVILEEIQRTSCQPREVCVEVAKEYPESTSQFFLPRCVALHRCGGCCNNEAFYCTNTSHTLVSKTVRGGRGGTLISILKYKYLKLCCIEMMFNGPSFVLLLRLTQHSDDSMVLVCVCVCITTRPTAEGPFKLHITTTHSHAHLHNLTVITSTSTWLKSLQSLPVFNYSRRS